MLPKSCFGFLTSRLNVICGLIIAKFESEMEISGCCESCDFADT